MKTTGDERNNPRMARCSRFWVSFFPVSGLYRERLAVDLTMVADVSDGVGEGEGG